MLDRGTKYVQHSACLFQAKRNKTTIYIADQWINDSTFISFTEKNLNETYIFSAVGEVLAYGLGDGQLPVPKYLVFACKKVQCRIVFFRLEHFFKSHGNWNSEIYLMKYVLWKMFYEKCPIKYIPSRYNFSMDSERTISENRRDLGRLASNPLCFFLVFM